MAAAILPKLPAYCVATTTLLTEPKRTAHAVRQHQITREGATREHKAALIEGATQLLGKGLDKNPVTTGVVIDEVEADNCGVAGETVTVRRARGA